MNRIAVVGLGSTDENDLTLKAFNKIKSGGKLFARTKSHRVVDYLVREGFEINDMDYIYDEVDDVSELSERIVEELILAAEDGDVIYLVPGSPTVGEETVELLLKRVEPVELIAGVSAVDTVLNAIGIEVDSYRLVDANSFDGYDVDIRENLIVTEIDDDYLLGDLKLKLLEVYPYDSEVYFVRDAGLSEEHIESMMLSELSSNLKTNHQTSLFIGAYDGDERYNISDALKVTRKLRSEDGCPWDMEQTHESLKENLIEEAYEVIDAIENDDIENLVEELGDLIYQVLLHSEIGVDEGTFNVYDVSTILCKKLIYRHPKVFLEKCVDNSDKLLYNWDRLKNEARDIHTFGDELRSVKGLPANLKAQKIISKAYGINFKWDDVSGVIEKVREELVEIEEAIATEGNVEEELGDLLFTVINLIKYLGFNSELVLNGACEKFITRFERMEKIAVSEDRNIREMDLDSLDMLWNRAKTLIG